MRNARTIASGKSQLTIRFLRRAIAEGRRPLLVCFNRPLADRLQSIAGDEAGVDSFNGFCADTIWKAGVDTDFGRRHEPGFWRELVEQIYTVKVAAEDRYDCLIVDEGQDFEEEWYEILKCFLTESASVLWLEDPMQSLRGKDPVPLEGFVTYRESANFRSPTSIGNFIKKSLDVDFRQKNPLPGLGVAVRRIAARLASEPFCAAWAKSGLWF